MASNEFDTPKGIAFPFQEGTSSFPEQATPPDIYFDMIKQTLLTYPGERVMRPTFGSRVRDFLFADRNGVNRELLKDEDVRAINRWVPDIELTNVAVYNWDDNSTPGFRLENEFRTPQGEVLSASASVQQ